MTATVTKKESINKSIVHKIPDVAAPENTAVMRHTRPACNNVDQHLLVVTYHLYINWVIAFTIDVVSLMCTRPPILHKSHLRIQNTGKLMNQVEAIFKWMSSFICWEANDSRHSVQQGFSDTIKGVTGCWLIYAYLVPNNHLECSSCIALKSNQHL